MNGPKVLDELVKRLRTGYLVDGQPIRVDEFEPEDDPDREFMRVKFGLGNERFPGFFFTFDAEATVEANLSNLSAFVRSHAQLAASAPSVGHKTGG